MWTIDDFKSVYQEFLASGKTVRRFCADNGIQESRFYHWQSKLRREVAGGQYGEFLPVSVNNRGGKVILMDKNHPFRNPGGIPQPACEICFPNGVTVRLNGSVRLEDLGSLVMLPR